MFKNALATGFVWLTAVLVSGVFVWLLADIIIHGLPQLSWSFLVEAPQKCRSFRRYRPDYRIDGVDFSGCDGNGGTTWPGYGGAIE